MNPFQKTLITFSKVSALLVFSLLLLFLEFSIPVFYHKFFHVNYNAKQIPDLIFYISGTILFFILIPAIINPIFFREKLRDLGLRLPHKKIEAILLSMVALVILVPVVLFLAKQHQLREFYSLGHPGALKLFFILVVIFPLYYFCEEFFFRGFLLVHLWKNVRWHSLWITDIIFTLAHVTKPLMEIIIALPAGIIFAYLALRTKSIFPSMFVHYCLGVLMLFAVI